MRGSVVNSKHLKRLGLTAAATALALAGCATHSPSERHADAGPVKPSGRLEAQAMAFESYMRRARGIDAGFSNAAEVSQALQVGAGYEPRQLEAGMVAYVAMAALQEPSFVAGVKRADRGGDLARRLTADPSAALDLPGGEAAAGRSRAALARQGEGLNASGKRVKSAAYSVQRQSWSKSKVADPRGRLARVKSISAAGYRPAAGDEAQLQQAIAEGGRRGGGSSALVARGVALAALTVSGDAGRGQSLLSEPRAGSCLRLAKLNLYQCLASAGPQYEDIYCLGQHAMMETAACVADATRAPASRRLASR